MATRSRPAGSGRGIGVSSYPLCKSLGGGFSVLVLVFCWLVGGFYYASGFCLGLGGLVLIQSWHSEIWRNHFGEFHSLAYISLGRGYKTLLLCSWDSETTGQ